MFRGERPSAMACELPLVDFSANPSAEFYFIPGAEKEFHFQGGYRSGNYPFEAVPPRNPRWPPLCLSGRDGWLT
jgi:hypothetical protein